MSKGFGTYKITDINIIKKAIDIGYDIFDTAELYKNEEILRDALLNSGKTGFVVITKISNKSIKSNQIKKSFQERVRIFERPVFLGIISKLIILLHHPSNDCKKDWEEMIEMHRNYNQEVSNIGVSNYKLCHLETIKDLHIPYINQIELSPFNTRMEDVNYCKKNLILIMSYSTLTKGTRLNDKTLLDIAEKHGITVAQLLLSWAVQNEYIVIPKASTEEHMIENLSVRNISIDDMELLNNLNENYAITKTL